MAAIGMGVLRMTEQASGVLSDAEKEELLKRVEEKAGIYMYNYGGCGQCSLRALQEELNLPGGPAAVKAAGFTNLGIALTQNICGALLGGIMAMGLACGRENFSDPMYPQPEIVDDTYGLPRSLMLIRGYYQRFIQEFGSGSCRDLQIRIFGRSFEMIVIEEEEKFRLAGGHTACVDLVKKAARMAAETILELPRR
ncbi:MAG: C-GCAxxG-C-C family protein [Acidobacteriota bacterium]